MKFSSSDRLFEEAARSPESYDKLLRKLKRERRFSFIAGLALGIIPIGFGIPLLIRMHRVMESPDTVSLPTVWGVPFNAAMISLMAAPLMAGIIAQSILMRHADACIKMLLFVRGQQSRIATEPGEHHDAP